VFSLSLSLFFKININILFTSSIKNILLAKNREDEEEEKEKRPILVVSVVVVSWIKSSHLMRSICFFAP
jgi:hypothetical protein